MFHYVITKPVCIYIYTHTFFHKIRFISTHIQISFHIITDFMVETQKVLAYFNEVFSEKLSTY